MYILILILIELVTFATAQYYISPVRLTKYCLENEYFNNCGLACDFTCENITNHNKIKNEFRNSQGDLEESCRFNCVSGCYCIRPLYRNRFGKCVTENECEKKFSRNDLISELNKLLNITNNNSFINSNIGRKLVNVNHNPLQKLFAIDQINFNNLFFDKFFNNDYFFSYDKNSQISDIDDLVENETDMIIGQISNGLKLKSFVKDILRSLIQDSKYFDGKSNSSKEDISNNKKTGLINIK